MSLRIITDSACDITQDEAKELNISVLPLVTTFGEEEFLDGVTITKEEFFEKLANSDELPHTSQLTPVNYQKVFEGVKEAGDEAVCIILSSKLSGCYESAQIALDGYEDCITLVDSKNVCIGQRILVELAVRLRNEGKSAEEIKAILDEKKKSIHLFALLDTLEYLKKGGRISPTVAFLGNMLSVKPVISIDDGEVNLVGKARGVKKSRKVIKDLTEKSGGIDFSLPFSLAYSGDSDALLQEYIEENRDLYGNIEGELPITLIGSTIGTHAGPGAIALAYFSG